MAKNAGGGNTQKKKTAQSTFGLFLEGTRANTEIAVQLQSETPKTGTVIDFYLGTESNPFLHRLQDASGADVTVSIGGHGFGNLVWDFTPYDKRFTTLTARQPSGKF